MRLASIAFTAPLLLGGFALLRIDEHVLSWVGGVLTGVAVCAWVWVRDTPPDYIENWRVGAEGEQKTAKALRPLERRGLRVIHDVPSRYGNYDHIAVGLGGVILLETKNLSGVVDIHDGVPRLRRRLDPEAETNLQRIGPRALAAAANLKEDIEAGTGHRTWVQAVVVFWADFPAGVVDDGRCVFVHGPQLREWIEARSDRLGQAAVDEISNAIISLDWDDAEEESRDLPIALGPA